jgi:hypothetical protein
LPLVKDKLLPLNEKAESQRATQVANTFGAISPGLVQNTTDLLFRDLWLRPALEPRDRQQYLSSHNWKLPGTGQPRAGERIPTAAWRQPVAGSAASKPHPSLAQTRQNRR